MEKLSNALSEYQDGFSKASLGKSKIELKRWQVSCLAKFLKDDDVDKLNQMTHDGESEEALAMFADDLDVNFASFKQKMAVKMVDIRQIFKSVIRSADYNIDVIKNSTEFLGKNTMNKQYVHQMLKTLCLAFDENEGNFQTEQMSQCIIRLAAYLKNRVNDPITKHKQLLSENGVKVGRI